MSAVDWSKEPKAVGALVTKPRNVHHPKTVFAAEFFIFGCMIKGTDCNGNAFSAVDDCWEWVPRPVDPWKGEGNPPVGTTCEFHGASAACPYDQWHPDLKDGDHVEIIAYVNDSVGPIAVFTFRARNEDIAAIQVEQARPGAFRPIRTPEQIAAEERQKACLELLSDCFQDANAFALVQAGRLYDAGWRKQVAP